MPKGRPKGAKDKGPRKPRTKPTAIPGAMGERAYELKKAKNRYKPRLQQIKKQAASTIRPESKEFDPDPEEVAKAKAKPYLPVHGNIPAECFFWLQETAINHNAAMGHVIARLVKCAMKGEKFHMQVQFSKLEKKFYANEIKKERRLRALEAARQRERGLRVDASDTGEHTFRADELKV